MRGFWSWAGGALSATALVACVAATAGGGDETGARTIREEDGTLRFVLTDAETSLRVDSWKTGASDVDLATEHDWSVEKHTLHGGRQEGVDVIDVASGALAFRVVPTRGMGLWSGDAGGMRLGWDSPVTEIVHPAHVNLDGRGGLGWLEGFGEWVNRCGLVSNGSPGLDEVPSNTGAIVPVQLTLHGKAAYIPARHVEVAIESSPEPRIVVRGTVDETMMFGPRLRLETEISTAPGSNALTVRDTIRNLAATPQEMQILYHSNFGRPLLEEGARFEAPVERVFPRDARAAEGGMEGWNVYAGPEAGYIEQVYFMTLHADDEGRTEVMLHNAAGDKGVSIRFSKEQLPYFTVWKNTAAEANGYVTGLEPATNYPNLRKVEREAGRVPVLEGGAVYETELTYTALRSEAEVDAARARIDALRAGRTTQVDSAPEE